MAHVGYNMRTVVRLVDWAVTGVENPMHTSAQTRAEEIEYGATFSNPVLRNLAEQAITHLDILWRSLPSDRWSGEMRTA